MKKNKILLLIVLVAISCKTFAQTGYIGKRNELSFDVWQAASQQMFNFGYKFAVGKRTCLAVDLGYQTVSRTPIYLPYYKAAVDGSSTAAYATSVVNKKDNKLKSSGLAYSFSLLGNGSRGNLNMPIGFYYGIKWEHYGGKQTETIDYNLQVANENTSTLVPLTRTIKFDYKIKTNSFSIVFGKDTYISKGLVIDWAIDLGLGYSKSYLTNKFEIIGDDIAFFSPYSVSGSYSSSSNTTYYNGSEVNDAPAEFYPHQIIFQNLYHKTINLTESTKSGLLVEKSTENLLGLNGFFLVLQPHIKVGYLF